MSTTFAPGALAGARLPGVDADGALLRNALLRSEKLSKITSALAEAVGTDAVYAAVVDECAAALGAWSGALWTLDADGTTASMRRASGWNDAQRAAFAKVPVESGGVPAVETIATGESFFLATKAELLARFPAVAPTVSERAYGTAIVPVVAGGRTLGSLGFTFEPGVVFDDDVRTFVTLVARYSGQALERLRLLDAERDARMRAEAQASRVALLSQASHAMALAASDQVLETVVAQASAAFCESCAVLLIDDDNRLQLVTVANRDKAATDAIRPLFAARPPKLGEGLAGTVATTGTAVLVRDLDPRAFVKERGVDDALARFFPTSIVVAPLVTRGRTLGVLVAGRTNMAPFDDDDRGLVELLAERAAGVIAKARLDTESRRARTRIELLYRLADAMNRAARVDDVFDATLDAIAAVGAARSSVLVFDRAGVMRFRAWRSLSDEYRAAVEGHSPWKREDASFPPVVVADALADPAWAAYRPLFEREGIGALAFIPLLASGALVGKFMMYWNERHAPSSEELDIAQAIASHAAAAVARFSTLDELQESVRFNELFTGMLGHDLRNPLSAILTAAQLLVKRGDERVSKPVARIVSSGERMSRMIDQLLDFTRVRVGGGIPLSPRPLDLAVALPQILDEHDDASPGWTFHLAVDGDARGTWDGDRLAQVFSNLVANAIQHGDPSAPLRVHVDGTHASDVHVVVENAGAIDVARLSSLFEPMRSRRDGSRGLGLGLYITKQIVAAHGGTIDVTSANNATRFSIRLPRTR